MSAGHKDKSPSHDHLCSSAPCPIRIERGNILSEALSQMIDALGLEVAAIRKKGGGVQIELGSGERICQAEGSWLYRFSVEDNRNLRDDTPVRVIARQEHLLASWYRSAMAC